MEAAPARRELGPTAWLVLEELALAAWIDGDRRPVAESSIRDLMSSLGLAKDTVARAVKRLVDAGVARFESDRAADGRFGRGRYVIDLSGTGLALTDCTQPRPINKDAARDPAALARDAERASGLQPALRNPRGNAPSQLDLFNPDTTITPNDSTHAPTNLTAPNPDHDTPTSSHHPNPATKPIDALAPEVRTRVNAPVTGSADPC